MYNFVLGDNDFIKCYDITGISQPFFNVTKIDIFFKNYSNYFSNSQNLGTQIITRNPEK